FLNLKTGPVKKKMQLKPFSTRTTYFLLSRDHNGELLDFIGPILLEEVETAKEEFQDQTHFSLEIIDELYFATCFPDAYEEDFYHNWFLYLQYHLWVVHGLQVEISEPILPSENQEEFALVIKDVGVLYRYCKELHLSFFVNADLVKAAQLHHWIYLYTNLVYDLKIQPSIYF